MSNVSLVDGHIDEPKMTDEDIKKAYEICYLNAEEGCSKCPLCSEDGECKDMEDSNLLRDVFDLINRKDAEIDILKAEIERLNKILENRGEICKLCEGKYTGKIKRAKAKAIKEFAERLKEKSYLNDGVVYIDDLVKEMVGE